MTQTPEEIAATYFEAWKAKDFDTLASILHPDATFRGPLGTAESGEECVAGLKGMSEIVSDVEIAHVFVDGPNVLTWFDLHTSIAPPASTANWQRIENGKITEIRVTFDPRNIIAAGSTNARRHSM
ncbi:nuclear transport factor 2 family protein [Rhodococcus sp. NPDC078407]|uniref:nuclear transport factor 2 family protein n=1 Tax=Rhodococcus sp. NPDC078407 TaxID=3364509 RepID=UPI0037C745C1